MCFVVYCTECRLRLLKRICGCGKRQCVTIYGIECYNCNEEDKRVFGLEYDDSEYEWDGEGTTVVNGMLVLNSSNAQKPKFRPCPCTSPEDNRGFFARVIKKKNDKTITTFFISKNRLQEYLDKYLFEITDTALKEKIYVYPAKEQHSPELYNELDEIKRKLMRRAKKRKLE